MGPCFASAALSASWLVPSSIGLLVVKTLLLHLHSTAGVGGMAIFIFPGHPESPHRFNRFDIRSLVVAVDSLLARRGRFRRRSHTRVSEGPLPRAANQHLHVVAVWRLVCILHGCAMFFATCLFVPSCESFCTFLFAASSSLQYCVILSFL